MNKKKLIPFIVTWGVLSACQKAAITEPNPIFNHVITHHTIMSVGIDYETKNSVALNPLTGQIVKPCDLSNDNAEIQWQEGTDHNPSCRNEIYSDNHSLRHALELSQETKPILTKVKKSDGSIVDATAIVSVRVLYPGSHCETYYSGGKKTTNCSASDKDYCKIIEPAKNSASRADKNKCEHYWK